MLRLVLLVALVGFVYSQTTCPPCPKKPTALPAVGAIPGDNFCPATVNEKQVLLSFYQTLGGSAWFNHQNWGIGDPCQNAWFGVFCNAIGQVTTLDLHSNNVRGPQIPPQLFCFPGLQSVVLTNNWISGEIPNNVCKATFLQYLTLDGNNLGGGIPLCTAQLAFLKHFYVQNNGLVGCLPDMSNWTNIQEFHCENNCLGGNFPYSFPSKTVIDVSFANNTFCGCISDDFEGEVVDFSGNSYPYAYPCWLNDVALGVAPANRQQITGSNICKGVTSCVKVLYST